MAVLDRVKAILIVLRFQAFGIPQICWLRIEPVEYGPSIKISIMAMALMAETFAVINLPAYLAITFPCGLRW